MLVAERGRHRDLGEPLAEPRDLAHELLVLVLALPRTVGEAPHLGFTLVEPGPQARDVVDRPFELSDDRLHTRVRVV